MRGTIVETHCVERTGLGPWFVRVDIGNPPHALSRWMAPRGTIPRCGDHADIDPRTWSARPAAIGIQEIESNGRGADSFREIVANQVAAGAEWSRMLQRTIEDHFARIMVTPEVERTIEACSSMAHLRRRHNATCPRCGGPAFQSLGLPKCEAEVCIAPDEVEPSTRDVYAIAVSIGDGWTLTGETGWTHARAKTCTDANGFVRQQAWATRALAVDAWRQDRRGGL